MEQFLPLISRCALFQGLSRAELGRALDCLAAVKKEYPRGAFLLRAGDQTGQMGLMLWGSALLVREDLWGRRNIIDKVLPGDVFAEAFAASGAALNLSAVAGEDCGVLLLDVGRVLTACPSACPAHHKIIQNLTAVLARKLLLLQDKITHMGRHTTREKLLSYLRPGRPPGQADLRHPLRPAAAGGLPVCGPGGHVGGAVQIAAGRAAALPAQSLHPDRRTH